MKTYVLFCSALLLSVCLSGTGGASVPEFGPVCDPINGHCYVIYRTDDMTDITWWDAKTLAESEGGYLATLLTQAEDRFVLDAFAGSVIQIGVRAWIGLTDQSSGSVFQWKWVTGPEGVQMLSYPGDWLPGEPSSTPGEDFVEWQNEPNGYGTNQAWNNVPSDAAGLFRYMVEFDSEVVALCKDVTVATSPGLCSADASIDDGSFDLFGDPLTLSQAPVGPYPLGDTTVTLTAIDSKGISDSCTATVTVIDNQPPVLASVSASPNKLWPPNHKMVPVTVIVNASDNCTPIPVCQIAAVSSNEPQNGLGDGDTAPDWSVKGLLSVNLRAERSGKGSGRIYTVHVMCTDASGNSATGVTSIVVPHDNSKVIGTGTPGNSATAPKNAVAPPNGKKKKK